VCDYMITVLLNTAQPEAWLAVVEDDRIIAHESWTATPQVGAEILQRLESQLAQAGKSKQDISVVAAAWALFSAASRHCNGSDVSSGTGLSPKTFCDTRSR